MGNKTQDMKKNCIICKQQFAKKRQSTSWWKTAKYCSQFCYSKRVVTEETRKKMSLRLMGNKYCLGYKHNEEARKNMGLSKIGRTAWNKGKKLTPEHRAKTIAGLMKNPHRFPKGEKPWNWIEDRTRVVVSEKKHLDGNYKNWMRQVKNRDYWKCQISNDDCSGRVEAHHILGWKNHPELRYEVKNGITLCHFHHPRKRVDEERYASQFQELIAAKES